MVAKLSEQEKAQRRANANFMKLCNAAVRKGSKWLDKTNPGWDTKVLAEIQREWFDISNGSQCIAGLTIARNGCDTGYGALCENVSFNTDDYGFCPPDAATITYVDEEGFTYCAYPSEIWATLQIAWENLLLRRAVKGLVGNANFEPRPIHEMLEIADH